MSDTSEQITLGGGCFWCTEAIFEQLKGIGQVTSGYAGGSVKNPTYAQVSSGRTGHAEVIDITFDPGQISLHDLLIIFFTLHDPTSKNRQGADIGPQYRSAIFYRTPKQKQAAEQAIAEITTQQVWPNPLVTTLEPLTAFYPADDYHQRYYAENQGNSYCQVVIEPKIATLRAKFLDKLNI